MTDPIDELLAGLRADVPEMTDEAFAAGRARVLTVVAPAAVPAEPEPAVPVTPLRKKRLLRSPPRRLVAAGAAAVVLAATALLVQAARSDGPVPVASAAERLNAAAENINPVDEPIAPGQYRYIATHAWSGLIVHTGSSPGPMLTSQEEYRYEFWVPADLAQQCTVRTNTTGNRRWLEGTEEQAEARGVDLPKAGTSEKVEPCDNGGDWSRSPSAEFLASLPRDPRRLYDLMRHKPMPVAISDTKWTLDNAISTLSSGRAPADLRAALYRALALLPGLVVTEGVNLDGHRGVAIGAVDGDWRQDLIVDPATGQFIGERTVTLTGDLGTIHLPPGSTLGYTSVSIPKVVNAVGETG